MRHEAKAKEGITAEFQSTHPLRDATVEWDAKVADTQFQSTHPLRDAT